MLQLQAAVQQVQMCDWSPLLPPPLHPVGLWSVLCRPEARRAAPLTRGQLEGNLLLCVNLLWEALYSFVEGAAPPAVPASAALLLIHCRPSEQTAKVSGESRRRRSGAVVQW